MPKPTKLNLKLFFLLLVFSYNCTTKLATGEDVVIDRVQAKGKIQVTIQTTITEKRYSIAAFQSGKFMGTLWTDHKTDVNGRASSATFLSSLSTELCQNGDAQIFDGGETKFYVLFNTDASSNRTTPTNCVGSEGYLLDSEKSALMIAQVDGDITLSILDYTLTDSVAITATVASGSGGSQPLYCHITDPAQKGAFSNRFKSVATFAQTTLSSGNATLSGVSLPAGTYAVYCLVDMNSNAAADSGDKEGNATDIVISSSAAAITIDSFTDKP